MHKQLFVVLSIDLHTVSIIRVRKFNLKSNCSLLDQFTHNLHARNHSRLYFLTSVSEMCFISFAQVYPQKTYHYPQIV